MHSGVVACNASGVDFGLVIGNHEVGQTGKQSDGFRKILHFWLVKIEYHGHQIALAEFRAKSLQDGHSIVGEPTKQ
jgi:hypothetical protein